MSVLVRRTVKSLSVHQGSVLSLLLFIIVLEALSRELLWGTLGGPLY